MACTGHQLTALAISRPLLEIPRPLLCEWKRKPKCMRRDLCAQSGWPSLGLGGGELPPSRQEGPPQFPFWGPHTPFSCLPSGLGRRPLFSSGRGPHWLLSLWNQWVTADVGGHGSSTSHPASGSSLPCSRCLGSSRHGPDLNSSCSRGGGSEVHSGAERETCLRGTIWNWGPCFVSSQIFV